MHYSRRHWLQQSTLALAGFSFATDVLGNPEKKISASPNAVLLNSNENPYGPSPMARQAMIESYLRSNRYPDDYIGPLKVKIAKHWGVNAAHILLGAGSSEIIGLAGLHVSMKKKKVVTAEPAYKVWNGQATSFGLTITRTALTAERKYDLAAMEAAIDDDTAMSYICNPNNPTGTMVDVNALKNFAEVTSKKAMVFIDEAYTEFAGIESLASLAATNKNIIVAKTFSKIYGLAGVRIGYAIAHPDTIDTLGSYQAWPNGSVSQVSVAAATASLDDENFVKDCKLKIEQAKSLCYETFKKLSLEYILSSANFILFNISGIKKDFIKEMETQNIYVQFRSHFGGKWCRVTMGTMDEMQLFCTALKGIV